MQKDRFNKIVSFLLGASWAVVLLGALIIYQLFSSLGVSISIFATIIFIIVSFFLILILDAFWVNREKLNEMKKQTQLLESIHLKLK